MKKKTTVIIIGLIILSILAGLIVPLMSREKAGGSNDNNTENNTNTTNNIENNTENNTGDDEGSASSTGNGSYWAGTDSSSGDSNESTSQQESPNQATIENTLNIPEITFPYSISGTDLVIEQVGAYDGYFIEDGSDKEVTGIAAIVLKNNGSDLRFVGIGIAQATRSLAFSGSLIPAGATVIIQEQNSAEYSPDPYYSATATTDFVDSFEMSKELVSVKDNGKNGFTVTNISGKTLPSVKVSFKNYLSDGNLYVGGIAYRIELDDIEPETSTEVTASHYDSEYSRILEVSVEQ